MIVNLLKRTVTLFLSLLITITMLPVSASWSVWADDGDGAKDNDIVKYYYQTDAQGQPTNIRTGIKKIILSPYTYNDVTGNSAQELNVSFLNSVVSNYLLDKWAPVADGIFRSHGKAANYVGNDDYPALYRGLNGGAADRFNVRKKLSNSNSVTDDDNNWGESEGWHTTGLNTANSLGDVRKAMAQEICNGMNRGVANEPEGPEKLLEDSPLGTRLEGLKPDEKEGEKKTKAFYNIGTYVDRSNGTTGMTYQSFGIVFYDFDLTIIADEKLQYITAAEKYLEAEDPLKAASQDETTKVKYNVNKGNVTSDYVENNSEVETENSVSLSNSDTVTVTTGMENSSSYSFREMVGSDFNGCLKE